MLFDRASAKKSTSFERSIMSEIHSEKDLSSYDDYSLDEDFVDDALNCDEPVIQEETEVSTDALEKTNLFSSSDVNNEKGLTISNHEWKKQQVSKKEDLSSNTLKQETDSGVSRSKNKCSEQKFIEDPPIELRSCRTKNDENESKPNKSVTPAKYIGPKRDKKFQSNSQNQNAIKRIVNNNNAKIVQPKSISSTNVNAPAKSITVISKEKIEKLSKPKNSSYQDIATIKYAKLSDEENCTFQPNLIQKKTNNSQKQIQSRPLDENNTFNGDGSFIYRMEFNEKERRRKIEREREETMYHCKVDKKKCPNCGQEQSFDEMKHGQMNCTNSKCQLKQIQYCHPVKFVWGRFQRRMEQSTHRKRESIDKICEQRVQMCEEARCQKSKRQLELLQQINEKKGESFMERMSKDIIAKKEKIKRIEEEQMLIIKKSCTFQPTLRIPERLLRSRTGSIMERTTKSMESKNTKNRASGKKKASKRNRTTSGKRLGGKSHMKKETSIKMNTLSQESTKIESQKKATSLSTAHNRKASSHDGLATKFEKLLL